MQAQMLGSTGQLKPYESLSLAYFSAMEKPLSLLGFMVEEQQRVSESGRTGGNKIQNAIQSKFELSGNDDKNDMSKIATDSSKEKGLFDVGKSIEWGEFFDDPDKYIKRTLSKGFLTVEKFMLRASAMTNISGMLLGGKHSMGTKLKDIREKDARGKIAESMSRVTGIPTSGIIAMETSVEKLMGLGDTPDDKKLAIMGGTYELVRLSTFFLQDIRKAMGVTSKTSMLGKMDAVTEQSKKMEDKRGTAAKVVGGVAAVIDKIPVLSVAGSLLGIGQRLVSGKKVSEVGSKSFEAAEGIFGTNKPAKPSATSKMVTRIFKKITSIKKELPKQTDHLQQISTKMTSNNQYLKKLTECPCDEKASIVDGVSSEKLKKEKQTKQSRNNKGKKDNRPRPKIISGSADETDAILEADQAETEKIAREQKMVDSVVNIEKLLKKCCKKGISQDTGKKDEPGNSFMKGFLESVFGSGLVALVATIVGAISWPVVLGAAVAGGLWYAIEKGFDNYEKGEKALEKNKVTIAKVQKEKEEKLATDWKNKDSKVRKDFEKEQKTVKTTRGWYDEYKNTDEFKNLPPQDKLKVNQIYTSTYRKYDKHEEAYVEKVKQETAADIDNKTGISKVNKQKTEEEEKKQQQEEASKLLEAMNGIETSIEALKNDNIVIAEINAHASNQFIDSIQNLSSITTQGVKATQATAATNAAIAINSAVEKNKVIQKSVS